MERQSVKRGDTFELRTLYALTPGSLADAMAAAKHKCRIATAQKLSDERFPGGIEALQYSLAPSPELCYKPIEIHPPSSYAATNMSFGFIAFDRRIRERRSSASCAPTPTPDDHHRSQQASRRAPDR